MTSLSQSDLQCLIDSAKRGSRQALGTLLETYRQYLHLMARLEIDRHLQAKLSASDIVQETFMQAQKAISQFKGTQEQELMAWLRKILASQLANASLYFRAARRDMNMERRLDADLEDSSQRLGHMLLVQSSSPSMNAVGREQAVLLADALSELAAHYREVIVLKHLEGRSFTEIAQRMDRTVASVKNLWARGLAKLRLQMGDAP